MKKKARINKAGRRKYTKPAVEQISVDNEISMVMMSPPGDPDDTSIKPDHFSINPFKFPKL